MIAVRCAQPGHGVHSFVVDQLAGVLQAGQQIFPNQARIVA